MKNKLNYLINKDKKKKKIPFFDYNEINGFNLISERRKVINDISINKLIIVDKKFIEKVINKKINKKVKSLLELLASICENDEDSGSAMRSSLNEVEKFKRIIQNEYSIYLNKKQIEILNKKIELVEAELRMKLMQYNNKHNAIHSFQNNTEVEEIEKSSRRRR